MIMGVILADFWANGSSRSIFKIEEKQTQNTHSESKLEPEAINLHSDEVKEPGVKNKDAKEPESPTPAGEDDHSDATVAESESQTKDEWIDPDTAPDTSEVAETDPQQEEEENQDPKEKCLSPLVHSLQKKRFDRLMDEIQHLSKKEVRK